MSLTELNPKQMGYGKTQIRPKQIMDHNNSITYTPHSSGSCIQVMHHIVLEDSILSLDLS